MKWLLGSICALLLLNVFAQQQTINDLRSELRKATASASASLPVPTQSAIPSDSATPTDSATPLQTAPSNRPVPQINRTGDTRTCNKWDKNSDWWKFTHAYLNDSIKYADYKVWFLYSQSYVDTFAFCFDKTFINKVNEIAATVS